MFQDKDTITCLHFSVPLPWIGHKYILCKLVKCSIKSIEYQLLTSLMIEGPEETLVLIVGQREFIDKWSIYSGENYENIQNFLQSLILLNCA